MLRRAWAVVWATAGFVLLMGAPRCGGSDAESQCEDACKRAEEQHCGNSGNCLKFCRNFSKLSEESGCQNEYDTFVSCVSNQKDLCTASNKCASDVQQFSDCAQPYCKKHLTECQQIEGP
jgi:hypothetical protein